MSQRIDRGGYWTCRLSRNGQVHTKLIHRLLAECFIPNPLGLTEVDHLDGDKRNLELSNLFWCTHAQNIKRAFDKGLIERKEKRVVDTATGTMYKSAKEAAAKNGLPYSTLKTLLDGNRTNTTKLRYLEKRQPALKQMSFPAPRVFPFAENTH